LVEGLGVDVPDDRISLRPSFSYKVLSYEAGFTKFVEIYEWSLAEAVASGIGLANLDEAQTD
jgi:hypothetical protein